MRIPLHLNPNDHSDEANFARIQLHTHMAAVTGGHGFRNPGRNSKPTRIERLGQQSFA